MNELFIRDKDGKLIQNPNSSIWDRASEYSIKKKQIKGQTGVIVDKLKPSAL